VTTLLTTDATSQNLNSARSSEAVQTLRGAQTGATDPKKIEKAARNFESLLVGHWLEQAEKSFASVPGTDPDQQNDSSRDQFMSIACQSLAQGLSRGNGFGIASMIRKQLEVAAAATTDSQTAAHASAGSTQNNALRINQLGISSKGR
jgi:Rod binding domain-containing protein